MREFHLPLDWIEAADTVSARFGVPKLKCAWPDLRFSTIWMEEEFFRSGDPREIAEGLLPSRMKDRLRQRHGDMPERIAQRVASMSGERATARLALAKLIPTDTQLPWTMYRTALGRPLLRSVTDGHGPTPYISFTHDGGLTVCIAVQGENVTGVGVDLVHLPRVSHMNERQLDRFAAYFLSPEELSGYRSRNAGADSTDQILRAAAHFSLMEAASKALGTGLRMGIGMGGVRSLPRKTISVWDALEEPTITFSAEAKLRARVMRIRDIRCEVAIAGELLLSVVAVLKDKG